MPTAPTITHAGWSQLQPVLGTLKRFAVFVRWNPVSGATSYDVNITVGADSISTSTGTVNPCFWWDTDDIPEAGDTIEVITVDGGGSSSPSVVSLTPISVSGATEIFTAIGSNVFSMFTLGPARPADWAWTLTGAPAGLTITAKTDSADGGIIVGNTAVEGVFNAVVGITNYTDTANIANTQNYGVTIHVSGPRYLADFHSDVTRRAINVTHGTGAVASWNFNSASELPVQLRETLTLHAILRNGTGFLDSGVTDLSLVAKLTNRPDGPVVLSATEASPTVATFGAVKGWPLELTADSEVARRIFTAANQPAGETPDAASIILDAQIAYTHGGKQWRTDTFKIRLKQPISL